MDNNTNDDSNLVKKACKELSITQKELSELLKVSKPSVDRWATGEVPESSKFSIELLLSNKKLKKENEEIKNALKVLSFYTSKEGVGKTDPL